MRPNLRGMSKADINFLNENTCRHRHRYISHYRCYLEEQQKSQKIGFLDIECSHLKADFGTLLSWCIKPLNHSLIKYDFITPKDLNGKEDKRITESCIKAIQDFNLIVTYYGTKFDIPYLKTKALMHNIEWPLRGSILHHDCYMIVKYNTKLSSNRLENACRNILGHTDKTRIENKYWRVATRGDHPLHSRAIKYILKHNKMDVVDLEKLYMKIRYLVNRPGKSL